MHFDVSFNRNFRYSYDSLASYVHAKRAILAEVTHKEAKEKAADGKKEFNLTELLNKYTLYMYMHFNYLYH